uniref:F-box domain-containing protein n=1 Tax=Plectus sambesii TaxID=2011161 RepID=A0A914XKQ6_9BILA
MKSAKRPHLSPPPSSHQKRISFKKSPVDVNVLPSEVLMAIFHFLPAKAIPKARIVCRRWNHLINSNADNLPKIYIEDISIAGGEDDSNVLCVQFDHHRRSINESFEWLLNSASKMRPSMQALLRHIVITSRLAFDNCKALTDAIFDELCQCSASFGERAGVALIRVDLRKITPNGLVRFLSSANSLFHFVDMDVVMVQQTFIADSSLAAITGGKLQRFHYVGFAINRQGKKVYDLKHVTGESLKHFAQSPTPLRDIALAYSSRIRPLDVISFIDAWQKNVHACKLSRVTLCHSSSVNYTLMEEPLLNSTFETRYFPRDRKFLIKHLTIADHVLEISLPARCDLVYKYDMGV